MPIRYKNKSTATFTEHYDKKATENAYVSLRYSLSCTIITIHCLIWCWFVPVSLQLHCSKELLGDVVDVPGRVLGFAPIKSSIAIGTTIFFSDGRRLSTLVVTMYSVMIVVLLQFQTFDSFFRNVLYKFIMWNKLSAKYQSLFLLNVLLFLLAHIYLVNSTKDKIVFIVLWRRRIL